MSAQAGPPPDSCYRTATGRSGESLVSALLERDGWTIVGRNWRTRRGEIDILAIEADTLVFIEVKTWPRGSPADLDLVIGSAKRKRMVETAKCFLDTHRQYNGMYIRFDVVLVGADPSRDGSLRYHHLKDAFSERVQ